MLVKLDLRQSEFGMSAGRLFFTWYFIHQINAGTKAALRTKSEMLDARRMLWMSDDSILPLSILAMHHTRTAKSYAKTYDNVASPVLETTVPTQSMSKASCFLIVRLDLGRGSFGSTHTPMAHKAKLVAAAR